MPPKNDPDPMPAAADHLPTTVADLSQRNNELEAFNRALIAERERMQDQLEETSRLLNAATTGLFSLDKTGLIESVNAPGARLLAADTAFLQKKPFGHFIAPEDQALFYIHRSRIGAGTVNTPLDVKLKSQTGEYRSVRIHAQPLNRPGQHLPGLLLAVEDTTDTHRALEQLQAKTDLVRMIFSIIDDLAAWSAADIDTAIGFCLEKLGLATFADRVYVCLFHTQKTRFSVTHEWLGNHITAPHLQNMNIRTILPIVRRLKKRQVVSVADMATLTSVERGDFDGFQAIDAKALLIAPLFCGRQLLGIIGCDAVRQPVDWSAENRRMLSLVGGAIVGALLRRQTENSAEGVQAQLLRFFEPPAAVPPDGNTSYEYEGPIEIIDDETDQNGTPATDWRFQEAGADDTPDRTLPLKDGQFAHLACRSCNRQRRLDISEIRALGSCLKATCVCNTTMVVKIELRRGVRKTVHLDGVLIRGSGDGRMPMADDWCRIEVLNLSRRGVGFKIVGSQTVSEGNRFQVKFNLDNTARSTIQKTVVVRSISGSTVGCQFEGDDPCDVTLGFYMMN
ncbi:GAF domain-containing protein [Desulfosarcina ovata]|nr:GAF domain-containing protein [Desulfosarcina ovata]